MISHEPSLWLFCLFFVSEEHPGPEEHPRRIHWSHFPSHRSSAAPKVLQELPSVLSSLDSCKISHQIEICQRKEDFRKFCLFVLNTPTLFFSPAILYLRFLQAMNDPYEELPALPHKELQEVLNNWLRSADSASTNTSTSRLHETYGRRMVEFLSRLPPNSPFRRPLLQVMTVGLRVRVVAEDFGLSQETVYASHRERASESILLTTEYTPKTKRARLPQEDLEFARAFMDEVFPQNSGRDFRVINMTDDTIYAVYFGYCTDRDLTPLGQTTFHDQILKKLKIHRSQDSTICCYCAELKKLESQQPLSQAQMMKYQELLQHRMRWYEQGDFFKKKKNSLIEQRKADVLVVVQDFTQLQVQGTFYQDFIVVFQKFDDAEDAKMKTTMHHFVASGSNIKNDGTFVIRTWLHMLSEGWFDGFTTLEIFSDGAGKHFKTTAIMNFFSTIQMFSGIKVVYNFFESNHGHSVCDAAASHVKKAISVFQRDHNEAVRTSQQIVEVANTIKNHDAIVAPNNPQVELDDFKTFAGIRSQRKFTFTETHAYGYKLSKDLNHEDVYVLTAESYDDLFVDL